MGTARNGQVQSLTSTAHAIDDAKAAQKNPKEADEELKQLEDEEDTGKRATCLEHDDS